MFMARFLPKAVQDDLRPVWRRFRAGLRGEVLGEMRSPSKDFSIAVPLEFSLDHVEPSKSIAIVCHLYDFDLAGEIHAEIAKIPVAADLFVSTDTEEKISVLREEFSTWKKGLVDIRLVADRGRDIAPKYIAFRDVYDRYDLVLFVHSKKTKQSALGAAWRKNLIGTLCGSREIVSSVLWMFARDPKLGVVFPQHFTPIRNFVNWAGEYPRALGVAKRMGIELRSNQLIDFPSGSMFWARSAALRPILDLGLTLDDFPEEDGQTANTIIHSLERLLLYACEKAGFRWFKICALEYRDRPATVVSIKAPEDFERFKSRHGTQLL